ncbi:MAG: galactose ABC transporter substrate-binding protein [Synergistales bacterium]|nr:galactose ABC transporter substrate-binding protein [Synergistaceae bacterium]MDY6399262.1 galactose ABC transporter substrate-binding protein [Synergistales bacterium]MDY6401712.1 galactose ABC transporter substrate-binding protein [Synergistales bacterium]MDY6404520.1 galactose ABC transporter substrate-binding protein [Synergistales bacterium]MDY6410413.1 galactose ABC transporter substrate-binding protein [Synergistales bacterium]
MKKHVVLFAAVCLAVSAVAAFAATDALVGACIYKFDDTFMTGVRNAMKAEMDREGGELEIVDSQNRQPMQNDQVDAYISKGANALIVNPVDRTAAEPLMNKAKAEGLPIVFINREPYAEVMNAYDKIWYVGAKAEESGTQSGQIIVDYFKSHPEADKNKDGKIQYIMLRGEQGHQDAVLRTEYSTKAMKEGGFEIVELGSDTANWDKVQATDKMKGFISAVGVDNIEAVLANNDDMALGAIEALKAEGYNLGDASKYVPVVGVDATAPALEAMSKGEMLGTVLNDADNQGFAAVKVAVVAADGKAVTDESIGYKITDGKYIWIPYRPVTVENYKEFMK